jgi:hypothetical protein
MAGGPAAKASLVSAISGQEERIASSAYGFREIADDLASNKISLFEAQERSRLTVVEMEGHMAAVEYAAGRISPEFAAAVSRNHENVREKAVDSIGYLLDMEDSPMTLDGEYSATGFRSTAAEPVYDATRDAADSLQVAAAQEIAAQFLPTATADVEDAFRNVDLNDPSSVVRYHEAGRELFEVTRSLRDMENDINGNDFHASQMIWAVGEMDRVLHSGGNRDVAVENLWSAVDSFQGGFGLLVQNTTGS